MYLTDGYQTTKLPHVFPENVSTFAAKISILVHSEQRFRAQILLKLISKINLQNNKMMKSERACAPVQYAIILYKPCICMLSTPFLSNIYDTSITCSYSLTLAYTSLDSRAVFYKVLLIQLYKQNLYSWHQWREYPPLFVR